MDEFLRMELHEEYARRMEDEHKRQNRRIELLEQATEQNHKLLASVERLALSMENMQREQREQGERLEILESRDGEMWRKMVWHMITVIITAGITYLFAQMSF